MERDLSQNAALCRSGCGFYGSPATDGLCSKCYKDAVKRKQAAPSSNTSSSSSTGASSNYVTSSETTTTSSNLSLLPPSACEMNLSTASPTITSTISSAQFCASTLEVSKADTEKGNRVENAENNPLCNQALCKNTNNNVTTADEKKMTTESGVNSSSNNAPQQPQKRKKTRCAKCKINVGVIGFECRCGGIFCSTHRYANEHSCSFDYKEHGAEEIRKNNPQIVGEKIQKI